MDLLSCGKKDGACVLLLGRDGAESSRLRQALPGLEREYHLLLALPGSGESAGQQAAELERLLTERHAGRIWGAYAVREGGEVLLRLLSGGNVRVRSAVLDGTVLPARPDGLVQTDTKLFYWFAAGDRAAKKTLRLLRERLGPVNSVALKKLKAGQLFADIRADLMEKRLLRCLGRARTVSLSAVLAAPAGQVFSALPGQPESRAAALLTKRDAVIADRERLTYITGGSGKLIRRWSHLVQLREQGERDTLCTDQVEMSAGLLDSLLVRWTRGHLQRQQKRLKKNVEQNAGNVPA